MDKTTFTITRYILSHMAPQQTTATSHNQEKDIYCLVCVGGRYQRAPVLQCNGKRAKSKKEESKRTEREGGKLRGMGVRRKFQKGIKVFLPPIRKVPLCLSYSSFLSL